MRENLIRNRWSVKTDQQPVAAAGAPKRLFRLR
jgi:hypothetical protein